MGTGNEAAATSPNSEVRTDPDSSNPGGRSPSDTSATRTPSPGGGGKPPTPPAGGAGAGKPQAQAPKPKVATIDVPHPNEPQEAKPKAPKKKPAAKPKSPELLSATQLEALLVSMSAIVAARPGMEIWQLSPVEAKQLATPLSAFIEKSEALKGLSEHSEAVALITALVVVFVPRVVVTMASKKEKRKEVTKNEQRIQPGAASGHEKKNGANPSNPSGQPSGNRSYDNQSVLADLGAIGM